MNIVARAKAVLGFGKAPEVKARYEAAAQGRRMRGWNPPNAGPNAAVRGLQKIRDRTRDTVRNDWTGESALQKWTTTLIGTGIVPRFKALSAEQRKAVSRLWSQWVKVADADGVLNFYGLQTLAVRSWLEGGEVFIRRRDRSLGFCLPVPLQIQLIEPDQVPLLDSDAQPGLPQGNRIRSGIEFDRRGQRMAYWMYREHPGENTTSVDASRLVRIPAGEVLHMFEPKRIGQIRGVSMAATVLAKLRNVENFEDAVLTRQMLANLFTMFIKKPESGPDYDEGDDPFTGRPIEQDDGGPIAGLEPGIAQKLLPGEDVVFSNPPAAGTDFAEYLRTQHLGTAAGMGLPYELFTGDILNISDRALRVIVNEFRRFAEQRQWQTVIPMMCDGVMGWFADAARLSGAIGVKSHVAVLNAEWAPHGWQYIHPVQDVQGKQAEVDAGFRSRSSVISERGEDPDQVDAERASDRVREDGLGVLPTAVAESAVGGRVPQAVGH